MKSVIKKAAFIFCRHYIGARVSVMPFAYNVLLLLDELGWEVDVFLAERPHEDYENVFSNRIRIIFIADLLLTPRRYLRKVIFSDRVSLLLGNRKFKSLDKDYSLVFGMGQGGLHFASLISQKSNSKLILLNDEFPEVYEDSIWKRKERKASDLVDITVVPDIIRFDYLCNDLPQLKSKPHFELINIPFPSKEIPVIDWHMRLGVSVEKKLFVHAGGVGDHNMTKELLFSVNDWDDDQVLILRVHSKGWASSYLKSIMPDNSKGKIIVYDDFLSIQELDSLILYCKASFAFYKPKNDNLTYVGKASGKLMRSIALGTPVIVSELPSFGFVEKNKIGFVLDEQLSGIVDSMHKIVESESRLRLNCNSYFHDQLNYREQWDRFYRAANYL